MKIFIITMDDPVFTIPFIKEIVEKRKKDITGIAVAKGGRLKIGKKRSKAVYIISLLLIMGFYNFFKNSIITILFKIKKRLNKIFPVIKTPSIIETAKKNNIPYYEISAPNDRKFLEILKASVPDIIINQSQHILKKEILSIPAIGILNRHNALLPRNRGRLTPFWVLYKGEKETGVSIHFVEEGLDSGPIVVQKKFTISKNDSFNSIAVKNYKIASSAMLEAIELLEKGIRDYIPNNEEGACYNTVPTLKEALRFRGKQLIKYLN